jgi:hypothetical protein
VLAAVGHQRDPLARPGQRRAVDGRVRDDDVVAVQPLRLGQREREDAAQPGVQCAVDQRPAAHGLGRQPHALAAGAAQQVRGVGVERVEVDRGEGRLEIGRGGVEVLHRPVHANRRALR